MEDADTDTGGGTGTDETSTVGVEAAAAAAPLAVAHGEKYLSSVLRIEHYFCIPLLKVIAGILTYNFSASTAVNEDASCPKKKSPLERTSNQ